jgi:DNA-binding response OmpR family regulator
VPEPLILVIEDEYFLLSAIEEALTGGGFASEIVSSGEAALTLFTDDRNRFRALVTDVNLGDGLSGWEVARRIRETAPTLPVIYLTAATAEEWASHGVPNSILISKPFAPAQLVTAVSQLLNVGSSSIEPT